MAHHLRPLRQPEPGYASSLKTFWAPLGTILVIIGAVSTVAWRVAGPVTAKADKKVVAHDEDRIGAVERDVSALKATADDLKDGQKWQIGFDLQVAQRLGVQPRPIPTPRPIPSADPFAGRSSP